MTTQVSQPQREALALKLLIIAPSRGATLFQVNLMVHEARWGGFDVQLLRKLRLPRQDLGYITFTNAFGEFNIPVVAVAQIISKETGKPQNERLYRIFQQQFPRQDLGYLTFANAFVEFNIPVVAVAQIVSKETGKPQNERLYRIFQQQMSCS